MILTGLNFFKEFGENKYLLKLIQYFDKFARKKQINKKEARRTWSNRIF